RYCVGGSMLFSLPVCRVVFFFSSRRRHTRCYRDWSSDVCSSDLYWRRRWLGCVDFDVVVFILYFLRRERSCSSHLLDREFWRRRARCGKPTLRTNFNRRLCRRIFYLLNNAALFGARNFHLLGVGRPK